MSTWARLVTRKWISLPKKVIELFICRAPIYSQTNKLHSVNTHHCRLLQITMRNTWFRLTIQTSHPIWVYAIFRRGTCGMFWSDSTDESELGFLFFQITLQRLHQLLLIGQVAFQQLHLLCQHGFLGFEGGDFPLPFGDLCL